MSKRYLPDKYSVERLNNSQPILSAVKDHAWESEVVFNPACVLLTQRHEIASLVEKLALPPDEFEKLDALCVLIYRAQGIKTEHTDYRRSRLGLALLTPALELLYRHPQPILTPDHEYEDLGAEDPRICRVDGRFMMLYTGYSSTSMRRHLPGHENKINICAAFSDDLLNWEKAGSLKGALNDIDDKNAVIFPHRAGEKYRMLHRPMEGENPMSVHSAHSDSLFGEWMDDGVVIPIPDDPKFSRSWIGAGAPPLKLDENHFLLLYHTGHYKYDKTREYDLGLCVLESGDRWRLIERIDPLMTPQTKYETEGNTSLGVNNVVFVCGSYFYKGYLYFPYAGADSVILGARMKLDF